MTGHLFDCQAGQLREIKSAMTYPCVSLVLVLGNRRGWPETAMPPHNLTMTMLGAGILWFGWFGFNAGSSGAADGVAVQAFLNTFVAAAAGMHMIRPCA